MAHIQVNSLKPKIGPHVAYPASVSDFEFALAPVLVQDIHLRVSFHEKQAWRIEDRREIEEKGLFRIVECQYDSLGRNLARFSAIDRSWGEDENPQVAVADVYAIPRDTLPKGKAIRDGVRSMLAQAVAELSPALPMTRAHLNCWRLEIDWDSPARVARTSMKKLDGGYYVTTKTIEWVWS